MNSKKWKFLFRKKIMIMEPIFSLIQMQVRKSFNKILWPKGSKSRQIKNKKIKEKAKKSRKKLIDNWTMIMNWLKIIESWPTMTIFKKSRLILNFHLMVNEKSSSLHNRRLALIKPVRLHLQSRSDSRTGFCCTIGTYSSTVLG